VRHVDAHVGASATRDSEPVLRVAWTPAAEERERPIGTALMLLPLLAALLSDLTA
jgi:hypothetical protein